MASAVVKGLLRDLRKEFGADAAYLCSELSDEVRRFSTGVFAIDFGTRGGLTEGRILEISGPEHGGKTTIAILSAVNFLGEDPNSVCVFLDAEGTFMRAWWERNGGDPERLILIDRSDLINTDKVRKVCNIVLKRNVRVVFIIDSVAALYRLLEDDKVEQPGDHARFVSRFLRTVLPSVGRISDISKLKTIICTNQPRSQIGYHLDDIVTGGKALGHFKSLAIEVRRAQTLKSAAKQVGNTKIVTPYGIEVAWKVRKDKVEGMVGASGTFKFYPRGTKEHPTPFVDNAETLVDYGLIHGVLRRKDKGNSLLWGDQKWSAEKLLGALAYNSEQAWAMRDDILRMICAKSEQKAEKRKGKNQRIPDAEDYEISIG